jgi:signal transduction histidine kinase
MNRHIKKSLLYGIIFQFCFAFGQEKEFSVLLKQYTSVSPDERIEAAILLSRYYIHKNQDSAFFYKSEAQKILNQSISNTLRGDFFRLNADFLRIEGNSTLALQYIDSSEKFYLKDKKADERKLASLYNTRANIYEQNSEWEKSLSNYIQSLKIYEKINYVKGIYSTYSNISWINYKKQYYPDAFLYAYKALHLQQLNEDSTGISKTYNNLGIYHAEKQNYDSSVYYFQKSITIREKKDLKGELLYSYANLGGVYTLMKKYPLALEYYQKSLKISEQFNRPDNIANCYGNIGKTYEEMGNYTQAKEWYEKYKAITEKHQYRDLLANSYLALANIYQKTGNWKQAYNYLDMHVQLNDSLLNKENITAMTEMQTKYETEKKEQENKILAQSNRIKDLEIQKKQAIIRWQAILFILSALMLSFVGYLVYQRQRIRLVQKSEQEKYKAMILAEEQERMRVAQELHDGIGQILSASKLILSNVQEEIPQPEVLDYPMQLVDNACQEVRNISHNLAPVTFMKGGFVPAVHDLVQQINTSNKVFVRLNRIETDKIEQKDEIILFRIVQEVLNNILKHAQATQIDIDIYTDKNELILSIKDNGKGFDVKEIEKSKGLGWKNIFSRANLLNGEVFIQSDFEKGTSIQLNIGL